MKTTMEPRTLAVALGLTVGLGIVVHELFLLVALGIGFGAAIEWTLNRTHPHEYDLRLVHRNP